MNVLYNSGKFEFAPVPYADIDVPRFLGFGMHMSAFIYAITVIGKKFFPSWYDELMAEGRKRFFQKSNYLPLRMALGIKSANDLVSSEVA